MEILIIGSFALFLVGLYGIITKKDIPRLLISLIIMIESSQLMLMTIGYITKSTLVQEMVIAAMVISSCALGIVISIVYRMLNKNVSIKFKKEWWK